MNPPLLIIKHCLSNSIKIKTKDTFSLPTCIMHLDTSQIKITPATTGTAEQTVPCINNSIFRKKENNHSQRIRKHISNGIKKVYLVTRSWIGRLRSPLSSLIFCSRNQIPILKEYFSCISMLMKDKGRQAHNSKLVQRQ